MDIKYLLIIFFAAFIFYAYKAPCQKLEQTLGKEIVEILRSSESAILYTLTDHKEIALNKKQLKSIQKILIDDKSYHFKVTKLAVFIPQYSLKLNSDLVVLFSLTAHQLRVVHHDVSIATLDFDPAEAQIKATLNEIVNHEV